MNTTPKRHIAPERPAIIEEIRAGSSESFHEVDDEEEEEEKEEEEEERRRAVRAKVKEPEFIIRSAGAWLKKAAKRSAAKMLFDSFWFEDELCILFADTNVGKSILAVQIGDSITTGRPIGDMRMTAKPGPVLYFDFELTDQQFYARYSGGGKDVYQFHKSFSRAVTNPLANKHNLFNSYHDYILNELENALLTAKAKVIIIDNITCLRYDMHAHAAALNLVRSLQAIKSKYQVSIMVISHTPRRNPTKPVTRNDLQGSKMLINFCDSAFAIGESQSVPGMRYLKQIKQRSSIQQYGAESVCVYRIVKAGNFLQFEFADRGPETDHLVPYTEQYRKNMEDRVAELHKQGLSIRQVAAQLSLPVSTTGRIIKRLERSHACDMTMKINVFQSV